MRFLFVFLSAGWVLGDSYYHCPAFQDIGCLHTCFRNPTSCRTESFATPNADLQEEMEGKKIYWDTHVSVSTPLSWTKTIQVKDGFAVCEYKSKNMAIKLETPLPYGVKCAVHTNREFIQCNEALKVKDLQRIPSVQFQRQDTHILDV